MARLHIPPVLEGRTLSPDMRTAMLTNEGETWTTWDGLHKMRSEGDQSPAVELIWHGEYGSIRRPMAAHLEGCVISEAVERRRAMVTLDTGGG